MYSQIKAIALILSAATSLPISMVLASPTPNPNPNLLPRQNGVTCQTSSGSPVTGDVTLVINEIRGRGGSCLQENGSGSDCTTLVTQGEAAISVCGGTDDDTSALSCEDVANFANQIQQTCLNGPAGDAGTRTGGTFTVNAGKRVEVINTSSV